MKAKFLKEVLSVVLCIALLLTYVPVSAMAAPVSSDHVNRVADPSTMETWRDFFLPGGKISTENAGGVWMDKSVFLDNNAFANAGITMDNEDAFLVALSAMATNLTVTGMSHVPTDTMLILDVSGSMGSGNNDVAQALVESANTSIASLLATNAYSRVGVVLYSGPTQQGGAASDDDAVLLLPLGRYQTGTDGKYLEYTKVVTGSGRNQVTTETVSIDADLAYEGGTAKPNKASKDVVGGTYIQKGVMLAANQLTAKDVETSITDATLGTINRKPVMVLMSDGAPTFSTTNFQNPTSINLGDGTGTSAAQGFVNQLTAAYAKYLIEQKYNTSALFYTISLGASNDSVALSVLDPDNANASTAVNDFWSDEYTWWGTTYKTGYLHAAVGETVSLGNNRSVTKIDADLKQNYVDEFINITANASGQATLGERLKQAFAEIVSKINLQTQYKPTLISQMGENHSGFISFVDKIGAYMQVTDVKGILINDTLYSGADLASNFVTDGGKLGTFDNPTALGHEMVAAVRQRLGLASDDEARTLIGLAYEYGQIRYKNAKDYSNYIGWYADANSKFLGFYQDGVTDITDPDAVYTIKSYGYLGVEHDSNMMYATVQVRHNIKTGEETVAFAVPAALIPVMTYNVSLDEEGDLLDVELSGSDSPIRLVYEVALDSHIHEWNVTETVSQAYLADAHNVNANGSVNFYTNAWEHTNSTGYNTVNTYSYFNPSRQNDKYYYTSDAAVFSNQSGTLYSGTSAPDPDGTFYHAHVVYEKNGSARSTRTVYRKISQEALETAKRLDGTNNWYIPSGNVYVNLDGYTIGKEPNATATISVANQPFVDIYGHSVNDTNHQFYVGATLGNNGRLTVTPQTGIKLSKKMADGVAAPDTPFVFDIFNTTDGTDAGTYPALLVKADGTEQTLSVAFAAGKASVELKADEVLYIGDLTDGETFRIAERETAEYVAIATGLSGDGTVTATQNAIIPVTFVNDTRGKGNLTIAKEVDHDFGVDYSVPADKLFTMQVTLSGLGTANATFEAEHTGGGYSSITTDANGQFTVQLAHEQRFEVFGLPTGTVATVVETDIGTGFTPAYYDNGVIGDGQVTVAKDSTVSVIVVNDYAAAEASPVNIDLGGEKIVRDQEGTVVTNWPADWEFTVVLERHEESGWHEIGRKTVNAQNKTFSFDMSGEVYDAPGVYSYQLYEIEPDIDDAAHVDGMIYDRVSHTFSVYVSDTDMDGRLEIVRVHSEHANKDFPLSDGRYTVQADFHNVQTVTVPAQVIIKIKKNLTNESGSPLVSLAGYNFGLYKDAACTEPAEMGNGIDAISLNPTDAVGEGWIDIQLSRPGDYVFYVKELSGGLRNMQYSTNVIQVVISVAIHPQKTDVLAAEVQYFLADGSAYTLNSRGQVEFTNVYAPDRAELAIDFVRKELSGRDLINGEFSFAVKDANGATLLTGKNNASGKVSFNKTLKFTQVGSYYYTIVETSEDGNGVIVDKTTYRVLVTVTDANGQLTATYNVLNATDNHIVFRNIYDAASTTYTISGTKNLTGRTLLNDEFTFVLTEALNAQGQIAADAKTYEAHNEYHGQFTFPTLAYTKAGTYYYVVSEKQSSGSSYGIQFDTNKYVVTVTVSDDTQSGKLVASANLDAEDIVFNNRYVANPVSTSIDGEKVLNGKTLADGQFRFELWQSDPEWATVHAEPIQTVENDGDGNFAFSFVDYTNNDASDFTKVGTYFYLIKEVDGGATIQGITYDDTVYRVRVEITDDLLGQLHATVHIYDDEGVPQRNIVFNNSYELTGSSDLTISGTKKLNDAVPENRIFAFELYKANSDYAVDGSCLQTAEQDAQGNFEFVIRYNPEDVSDTPYYYVVKEVNGGQTVNGVTYDDTVYRIEVWVEDDDQGGVKSTAIIRKGENVVTSLDFANTYKAANGTVSVAGTKLLENRELADGEFKFLLYKADENYEVDAQTAPKEAKNNADGSFAFEDLTFEEAGMYYFVIVEDAETTAERVTNDTSVYYLAIEIRDDGEGNLYEASRVIQKAGSEDAVEEITFTNVFTPEEPDVPKTADAANPQLWLAVLFVSGGVILGTAVYGRKKEEKIQ